MKRRLFNIVVMLTAVAALAGPKTRQVEVEYIYQIPDNVTAEQSKATALERAKMQAIADEFGTVVTQSNTTSISVDNGEVSSGFMSLGGSELKGEWIETIGSPEYEFLTRGESLAVKVRVKGRIRELNSRRVPVQVKMFRNGVEPCDESCNFNSGDAMYMSFKASANGFLAVYLVDAESNVFCLCPYQNQSDGFFPVRSNHSHMLFNRTLADGLPPDVVDEFVMDTGRDRELNRIVAVFSPNKFYKAVDTKSGDDLPRLLSLDEFEKWLGSVKRKDPELAVTETFITITK